MANLNFIIRDGIASDIDGCIALDHSYETDHVWQMTIMPEGNGWQVRFRKERLPRPVEIDYPADEERLSLALPEDVCFLVAQQKEDPEALYAYLAMRFDPVHKIALVQDIVVSRDVRRRKIASRLLGIARMWAVEHQARQLMMETQTKNYPAIAFCQRHGLRFCGFNDQYYRNQDIAIFFGQTLR